MNIQEFKDSYWRPGDSYEVYNGDKKYITFKKRDAIREAKEIISKGGTPNLYINRKWN